MSQRSNGEQGVGDLEEDAQTDIVTKAVVVVVQVHFNARYEHLRIEGFLFLP